ncbi:MAG: hypothetical protein WBL74_08140 [Novosphingobium sp.]|uniref:hypothetical protein n=1 Tax=Novosphingobium sp. TaxID=1874826 RepID=UPI003C7B9BA9
MAKFDDMRFCPSCGTAQHDNQAKARALVVKEFAVGALANADEVARDLLSNPTIKKVAGGAMLGLGVAAVIPFLTFTAGATIGAAYVGYKALTKD